MDADLKYNDEYGVEAQLLYQGELAYGRRWITRELAVAEAEDERQELERDGWNRP